MPTKSVTAAAGGAKRRPARKSPARRRAARKSPARRRSATRRPARRRSRSASRKARRSASKPRPVAAGAKPHGNYVVKVHRRSMKSSPTRPGQHWNKGTGRNEGYWVCKMVSKKRPAPKASNPASHWAKACKKVYATGKYKSLVPRKGSAHYKAVVAAMPAAHRPKRRSSRSRSGARRSRR